MGIIIHKNYPLIQASLTIVQIQIFYEKIIARREVFENIFEKISSEGEIFALYEPHIAFWCLCFRFLSSIVGNIPILGSIGRINEQRRLLLLIPDVRTVSEHTYT